jgi:hypothetical protein
MGVHGDVTVMPSMADDWWLLRLRMSVNSCDDDRGWQSVRMMMTVTNTVISGLRVLNDYRGMWVAWNDDCERKRWLQGASW